MEINNISLSFGTKELFKNFSISFTEHKITSIMGPSGIGKTSLLNILAFDFFSNNVSYIFQEPRLLPWCSIEKNIMLAIQHSYKNTHECKERAHEYIHRVGLLPRLQDYPSQLSGGERQRVSIARAFASNAPILLMDEPFQSQDQKTKNQLISIVEKMQHDDKKTIVAVTHDISETLAIADRLIILNGQPVQIVYDQIFSNLTEVEKNQTIKKVSQFFTTQIL